MYVFKMTSYPLYFDFGETTQTICLRFIFGLCFSCFPRKTLRLFSTDQTNQQIKITSKETFILFHFFFWLLLFSLNLEPKFRTNSPTRPMPVDKENEKDLKSIYRTSDIFGEMV